MAKVDATGRSKGDARHVRLYEWMLKAPAYRHLSSYGRCLLIELKRLYMGENNGDVFLSVRMAAALLDANKDTATKAFRELQDLGFIKASTRSAFDWKRGQATSWILTEYGHADQLPTKDFMKWQAPTPTTPPAEPAQNAEPGPTTSDGVSDETGHLSDQTGHFEAECPTKPDTLGPKSPLTCPATSDTLNLPSGSVVEVGPVTATSGAQPRRRRRRAGPSKAAAAPPSLMSSSSRPRSGTTDPLHGRAGNGSIKPKKIGSTRSPRAPRKAVPGTPYDHATWIAKADKRDVSDVFSDLMSVVAKVAVCGHEKEQAMAIVLDVAERARGKPEQWAAHSGALACVAHSAALAAQARQPVGTLR